MINVQQGIPDALLRLWHIFAELDINDMGTGMQNPRTLWESSTCTVFAESEVISLLSQKKRKILSAGFIIRVVSRAMGLLMRTPMKEQFVMTGGVAYNSGVVRALERESGHHVYVSEQSQKVWRYWCRIICME